jgi:hypothetical protein
MNSSEKLILSIHSHLFLLFPTNTSLIRKLVTLDKKHLFLGNFTHPTYNPRWLIANDSKFYIHNGLAFISQVSQV